MVERKKLEKYTPGPGDPSVPPQLTDFHGKTTDEVLEELNKMPFFMTKLDSSNAESVELEALKALAYEGEPHEVAGNFKNQGNDLFRVKRFADARELYTKGIAIKCEDSKINESLFLNRAACELELKNYRKCITDCREALKYNVKSVKAYYRIGKAFLSLRRYEDAEESVDFGLRLHPDNKPCQSLKETIEKRIEHDKIYEEKRALERQKKERLATILTTALEVRNITSIKSHKPSEFLEEASLRLEDPEDIESQLLIPAMIIYPTIEEFDFVATVSELMTAGELIEVLLDRPHEWFEHEGRENFEAKKLVAFMETQSGGLIKVGKKVSFHNVFIKESPKIPLFDNALRVYIVPKIDSDSWLSAWDKGSALSKRF